MRPATISPAVAELSDVLAGLVRRVSQPRFSDHVAARAGSHLDRSAYVLLSRLAERPDRIGSLAEAIGLDTSTVSRQVYALEGAGLVERKPDPADRRAAVINLTADGRAILAAHRRARQEVYARCLDAATAEELATTVTVLRGLAARLDALGDQ